ncbi:hypothetical protein BIW11_10333 [Tropilaelaps mercedesae]|uniref:Uncharacterized protein n=1 Tax=Tropilaelaps mercedesae TaxID=418985 RepID=A0A1V9XGN7_9ACAR|nr:hypothetical protein BIW11_10333 [Tropilaelaps mercedesae]
MARVSDIAPSWEHRSVYWRTTVNRQFTEDNQTFVCLENRGITEIFRVGILCLKIDRLERGKIENLLSFETTSSSPNVGGTQHGTRTKFQGQFKGGKTSQKRSVCKNKMFSSSRRAKNSSGNTKRGTFTNFIALKYSGNKIVKSR